MTRRVLIGLMVMAALVVGGVVGCDADKEKTEVPAKDKEGAAVAAAEKWLALVDQAKYDESYGEASSAIRNALTTDQWKKSLENVREPLGELASRKVKSKSYKTSLPGAPDGEYVIIEFEATFKNGKTAIETVTPTMEKGEWRVAGYYIRETDAGKEAAAVEAAEKWLALVDQGEYGDSWDQAAKPLRDAFAREDWNNKLNGVRTQMGELVSRKMTSAAYAAELPGAPRGNYVVIEFDTSFEKKKTAIETVTPMLENGEWKVSGYFIK